MISPGFASLIESDLNWREKEMALVRIHLLRELGDETRFRCMYRALIALTYAHYEGYVKRISSQALAEIKSSTVPSACISLLKVSLLAPTLRKKLNSVSNEQLINLMTQGSGAFDDVGYPSDEVFMDISNMNVATLSRVLQCIGVDYDQKFSDFSTHINNLVYLRHKCAHGEAINFDASKKLRDISVEISKLQEKLILFMHYFAVEIVDHFNCRGFKTPPLGGAGPQQLTAVC